jgi:hypothetical protein
MCMDRGCSLLCAAPRTLTMIHATHMPPRTQMNEIRVAAGKPLLWMIREVPNST